MAKLTAAARKKLPASAFAGPDRSFPIQDKAHAQKALQFLQDAPPSARAKIKAAATTKLAKRKSK